MLPTIYLHQITFTNLPYALALSLRNRVVAWSIRVPDRFAGRFIRLRAHALFSWDEWMLLEDECYTRWKETVLPHYRARFRCKAKYRSEEIDFSPILWQHLGDSFERFFLFLAVARKHATAHAVDCRVVAPLIAGRKGEQADLFDELRAQGFVRLRVNGKVYEMDSLPALQKTKKHTIEIVVDRLKVSADSKQRLAESFETALRHADGRAAVRGCAGCLRLR